MSTLKSKMEFFQCLETIPSLSQEVFVFVFVCFFFVWFWHICLYLLVGKIVALLDNSVMMAWGLIALASNG